MQFRIGDRDPVTGLYNVIYPDGSSTPNGIKIYNAEHRVGDIVNATKRGDGMIILDNPIAADPSSLTVSAAGNRDGYLNGQVFNGEEVTKRGRAFVTTYDAYLTAKNSGSYPLDIAKNDPGTQILSWSQEHGVRFMVIYPKSKALTSVVLKVSTNMLPIERLERDPTFSDNYWTFGTGVDSERLGLGVFPKAIYEANASFTYDDKIQMDIAGSIPNPSDEWFDFDVITCAISPISTFQTPFIGKTIDLDLFSVTNSTVANSRITISVIA